MDWIKILYNTDRIFALVMIIFSAVMYALIGGMEEPYSPGALAASTYPRLILGGIIFVSCLLIIRPPKSKTAGEKFSPKGVAVILLMSIYIALLEKVGFFILTPLFLFALPVLAGFRRYGVVMASVLVVTAALYGIFIEVLNIPLPAGLLGD